MRRNTRYGGEDNQEAVTIWINVRQYVGERLKVKGLRRYIRFLLLTLHL